MGSVVIYPPSPDILQRSRERAVKGQNARRLRRLALDGLARLCYFRQGGGGNLAKPEHKALSDEVERLFATAGAMN